MLAAVVVSFFAAFNVSKEASPHLIVNISLTLIAMMIGGGVAWWTGRKVALTAMPETVALFNGMGGGAAAAIAAVELSDSHGTERDLTRCFNRSGFVIRIRHCMGKT